MRAGGRVEIRDGERLVAEAKPVELEVDVPAPVSVVEAARASARYAGFAHHAYNTCYVCGPNRGTGCASTPARSRAGTGSSPRRGHRRRTSGRSWSGPALYCPSGWVVDDFQREGVLLGRMATEIDRLPTAGEPHVVIGWRVGEEGRKRFGGSALLTAEGEVLARSRSTWIVLYGEQVPLRRHDEVPRASVAHRHPVAADQRSRERGPPCR